MSTVTTTFVIVRTGNLAKTWSDTSTGKDPKRFKSGEIRTDGLQIQSTPMWQMQTTACLTSAVCETNIKKGSPYSIIERRVPELIPVLRSQPAGDVSHKPSGRLPLLSTRPTVTPVTLRPKRAATNFAAWWTEAQWVWTVCLRLLLDSVATAIWTRALLRLSPAR